MKPKINKFDYLIIVGLLFIFLLLIFLIHYYFTYTSNECLKQPFVYGAKQLELEHNGEFSGYGYLRIDSPLIPTLNFNSTNQWWIN